MRHISPLQALHEAAPQLGLPPAGYRTQMVSFQLTLYPDGQPARLVDVRPPPVSGRSTRPRPRMDLPAFGQGRTNTSSRPWFLWDNARYALGLDAEWAAGGHPNEGSRVRRQAFRDFHLAHCAHISHPAVEIFHEHLISYRPDDLRAQLPELDVTALFTSNIVFAVDSYGCLHDLPICREIWAAVFAAAQAQLPTGFCPILGTAAPQAAEHVPVKNVPSVLRTPKLVSFNLPAFETYRARRLANAPMSFTAADQYGKALNALTEARESHVPWGGAYKTAFWMEPAAARAARVCQAFLSSPALTPDTAAPGDAVVADTVRLLQGLTTPAAYTAAWAGEPALAGGSLQVLTLAGGVGRVAVQDWQQRPWPLAVRGLLQHRLDCWVEPHGFQQFPPGPQRLLHSLIPNPGGQRRPTPPPQLLQLAPRLLQAMLDDTRPYPPLLVGAVLRAIRRDQRVNAFRCALLRGTLVRAHRLNHLEGIPIPMSLNPAHPDVAYTLGRLFALLERSQEVALNRPQTTIRTAFFSLACTLPAATFPSLVSKGHRFMHLLRQKSPPAAGYMESQIGQVTALLPPELPAHLDLPQQSTFAVGYYHQRQQLFQPHPYQIAPTGAEVPQDE